MNQDHCKVNASIKDRSQTHQATARHPSGGATHNSLRLNIK